MACKDSIFVERGRGWCGIIGSGSRPSWARGERQALYARRFREDERIRRRRASKPAAVSSARTGSRKATARERLDLDGWATEGDRDLFAEIAAGRSIPSARYLERALWRNRELVRSLARGQEWARKLAVYIPSERPA